MEEEESSAEAMDGQKDMKMPCVLERSPGNRYSG